MKPIPVLLAVLFVALSSIATAETDTGVLLRAYTRYVLAQEIHNQILQMARPLPKEAAEQVRNQAKIWIDSETTQLRENLSDHFGGNAKNTFAEFVAEYTTAESKKDVQYLGRMAAAAGLKTKPKTFPEIRRQVLDGWLAEPFAQGSKLLGGIQAWTERLETTSSPLTLSVWLGRSQALGPADSVVASAPARPVNPLAAAEAAAPEFTPMPEGTAANPMEAFAKSRQSKRERALQEAQAGMQQLAMERQTAEQEYAARKTAEAQADADAMRAQAQKLAAVEQEAVDQRANSWMGRLKGIVSATIGAATGAFTGGIGTEAGHRAADALFHN